MSPHPVTIEQFPLTEEIIYYDGPVLFISLRQGVRYLVLLVDTMPEPTLEHPHAEAPVYLASPMTPEAESALRTGLVGTRAHIQSLPPESLWVLREGRTPSVTRHPATPVPEDWLPTADATLSFWLRPTEPHPFGQP